MTFPAAKTIPFYKVLRPALAAAVTAAFTGCWNSAPAVIAPDVDADEATAQAYELYDTNTDGALSEEELFKCPGVLQALTAYDSNSNKQIERDEFTARIEAWRSSPAMMPSDCRVTLDGRILSGAEVRFVPEPYLAAWLSEGHGTTNAQGTAAVGVSSDLLPEQLKRVRAMYVGTYKVRITHSTIKVPEAYNASTTLGREISAETRAAMVHFDLKTK